MRIGLIGLGRIGLLTAVRAAAFGMDILVSDPMMKPDSLPIIHSRAKLASFDDLLKFFEKLPNPDKTFTVMAGISHASFQQKNYLMVYHILHAYFTQPEPVYR